jgi:hypothetical protein
MACRTDVGLCADTTYAIVDVAEYQRGRNYERGNDKLTEVLHR